MALASASQRVGGGAKIAEKWRKSAGFDPIAGGPGPRSGCCRNPGFFPAAGQPGRLPVATASGPDCPIAGRLPVAGDNGQLATGGGPVCLGQ